MNHYVYLPRALHPKLERALVIGYGIGNTVRTLVNDPTIKHIDVVDVSREALALSRDMHARFDSSPLDDPRVHVHIEDGRHFLAGRSDKYDLITGEPRRPSSQAWSTCTRKSSSRAPKRTSPKAAS